MTVSSIPAVPTPRFSIGQRVWFAWDDWSSARWPCPDCDDTRVWLATSATGERFHVACPRCSESFRAFDLVSLNYRVAVSSIRELTIGSVRIDTAQATEPVQYRCEETGVGSGNVYRERELFETRAEAEAVTAERDKARQSVEVKTPSAMTTEAHGQYPLRAALQYARTHGLYESYALARGLRRAIERIWNDSRVPDADDMAEWQNNAPYGMFISQEVRAALEAALAIERGHWFDPHPLEVLLKAAHSVRAALAVGMPVAQSELDALSAALSAFEEKAMPQA